MVSLLIAGCLLLVARRVLKNLCGALFFYLYFGSALLHITSKSVIAQRNPSLPIATTSIGDFKPI